MQHFIRWWPGYRFALAGALIVAASARAADEVKPGGGKPSQTKSDRKAPSDSQPKPRVKGSSVVPDPRLSGGETDSVVQVANLVYAGVKSSRCFADRFLVQAEKESAISTSRRFHAVKLAGDAIYEFPLVIMTGEGDFQLSDAERESLRRYVERGGFLLASAGCSSTEWDHAFRREMAIVFPSRPFAAIQMDHPVFHTVYDITELGSGRAKTRPLEGIRIGQRLGVIYSEDGLNDAHHREGCCCCGGSELSNAAEINVNILAYALTY
ncbi:MAG: DUF4159 domain-containing protein [Thermoguttaceae bacterium]|jgi:hypothetical protein